MQPVEPYNEEVRRRFLSPAHAGDVRDYTAAGASAEARESANGARVLLAATVENGIISCCRHRTWGCPHLIAAADLACEQLESASVAALAQWQPNEIMRRLSVPVEKTGRILLLEDAVKSLAATLETKRRK